MEKNIYLYEKVTVVIVTFKSEHIIEKCLDNIGQNYNIILVENSNNIEFTNYLKKKYKNLETINIGYDSGFGFAFNRGVENVQTEYIVSINPDSFPKKDCFAKLIQTADENKDVACVVPATYLDNGVEFWSYGYFDNKKKVVRNEKNELIVDWVNGNVVLLKKDIFNKIGMFDENIFIEYDEIEFQTRIFKETEKKIIINFNAKSLHLEGKSANKKYAFEMKCEKIWHNAWSKYYYLKKHYGIIYALKKNLSLFFINFIKMIIFYIINNKIKSKLYSLAVLGFIYSLFNKKSLYRADID